MNELLQSIRADLLSRRLLPFVAIAALALVGGVGYVATAGSGSSQPPVTAAATPPVEHGTLPVAVASPNGNQAVAETPGGLRYQSKGPLHDPFQATAPTSVPSGASASATKTAHGGTATKNGGSPTSSKPGSSTTSPGSAPAPTSPQPAPAKPAPQPLHTGLTPKQSYALALSLTSPGGNLDAIDSLKRLSELPSEGQPLLVYLGVLDGGRHALFAVLPGTAVKGPGGCTPGPTDCEILSLAPNQIESLATSAGVNVALFTVTAIKVVGHPTVAAANRARSEASAVGNTRLQSVTLPTLALFEYQPALGAIVDLRNLAVGGEK